MAVGGSYKGNSGGGGGSRGRPYGLMLLLAFGAALLGVMVVHKIREKRIFNLLVKDKDRHLISLQLLLQKEREYTKAMKRKTEEMKMRMYSLQTQKMELDGRVLEMQSIIDSLKDEQKIMESTLEDKQSEIKMLRATDADLGRGSPQIIALTQSLKQKEAEIENLRHRLEPPAKVWSVSTDDPSKPPVNLTVSETMAQKDKVDVTGRRQEAAWTHQYTNNKAGENSMNGKDGNENKSNNFREGGRSATFDDGTENRLRIIDESQKAREQSQKPNIIDERQEKKDDHYHNRVAYVAGEGQNARNVTEVILQLRDNEQRDDRRLGKTKNFKLDGQELLATFEHGKKMEMADHSENADSKVRGQREHISRTKGKRLRTLAKKGWLQVNGNSQSNGAVTIRTFSDNDGLKSREGAIGENNSLQTRKVEDPSYTKLATHQKPEYENLGNEVADTHHQAKAVHEMLNEFRISQNRQELTNRNPEGKAKKQNQNQDEGREQGKQEANGINSNINRIEQPKVDGEHKMLADMEAADMEDLETDAANTEFPLESSSSEDNEEYKEENDEREF